MSNHSFMEKKVLPFGQIILLFISTLLFSGGAQAYPDPAYVPNRQSEETLIAQFAAGPNGVTSEREYSGRVTLTVSEIGQASSTQYSDAFYILTDFDGTPIEPWHPLYYHNWVLWINGQHAESLIPDQQVPSYSGDHIYKFEIDAPGGNLTFGVGDILTYDNTGSYTISIDDPSSRSVPFFSQRNPQWANYPLRTNGVCSTSCSTIGACGCTLTSAAMLFAYYGADLTPPILSDCMGTNACPFDWNTGASCSNNKASWVGPHIFSWARLDQELNQSKRPIILGMHRSSNIYDTHWVLVTSGHGSNAGNYLIHDPWPLNGANTNLAVYTRQNYVLAWLRVYAGLSVFTQTIQSDEYLGKEVIPTGIPKILIDSPSAMATVPVKLSSDTPVSDTFIGASSKISGSILIYHVSETAVTVQLTATSIAGDVTEMQIWTDSDPTLVWQAFASFAWLPWMPEDKVYACFRDKVGNVSDVYTDSISPIFSPPPELQIFLPIILKSR